jgi:hypothetical protein
MAGLALLATGCGGVEKAEFPLHEDFTECGGYTMNNAVANVDCPNGELRILVSQPEVSPIHLVPLRFESKSDSLVVSADVRAPVPGGYWGIGCLASGPDEPGRGYALLMGGRGEAGIVRMDARGEGEEGRPQTQLNRLSVKKRFVLRPASRHKVQIRCSTNAEGVIRIRASADGGEIDAADRRGLAPFRAAIPIVVTDRPNTDVRFDNVTVDDGGRDR